MSNTVMSRIQAVQLESSVEADKASREDLHTAIDKQRQFTEESYQKNLKEVSENKEAREKEQKGALLGTIFGGFLIGSLIGKAIGNAAGDGNKDAARDFKKQTGVADLQYDKAKDQVDQAKDRMQDAKQRQDDVRKFSNELRDDKFIGIG